LDARSGYLRTDQNRNSQQKSKTLAAALERAAVDDGNLLDGIADSLIIAG
jgi:hypothetical protein